MESLLKMPEARGLNGPWMGQELSGSFPDLRSVSTDRGRYIYGLNWIVYAIPNKRDILGSKSLLLAVPNVNFPSVRELPHVVPCEGLPILITEEAGN